MGFPRQEYWSGLPLPSPEDFRDPGFEPTSPALVGRFCTAEPLGKPFLPLQSINWRRQCGKLCVMISSKLSAIYQHTSLVAQMGMGKRLPTTQETWAWSLGWEDALEKAMAPTPVLLPGRSHGQRSLVGYSPWGRKEPTRHDWVTSFSLHMNSWASQVALVVKNPPVRAGGRKRHGFDPWVKKIPWRRKWQPVPVFLPGESQGQRSLVGYSPWGCKESDMTEAT